MNHLMIDLETMGNKPNTPVVSIGAIFFEPATGELGPEFYCVINLKSAMAGGAVPDADTIIWWLKQSPEARAAITDDTTVPLSTGLSNLNAFIHSHAAPKRLQVWGNGATFDNVVIRSSYDRDCIPCPWMFWNDRDVRTIVELGKAVGINPRYDIPFEGDMHNALADARHQAKYISAIWQRLIPAISTNI
ncbi:3'-5' exoribonuclease [Escherichia coli]|uniref:3'-5' exonuclease n=1 Tax=Escherichia coli TaxID=562 RepID=UPI001F492EFE|nr:3'-5' exonuclease [Escherichia coli]MCH7127893.1 3'-5' exoribonuclease [Escherichia coli]